MMGWYDGGMGGGSVLVWLLMGVLWLGLIALIVFLVIRLLPGAGVRGGAAAGRGPVDESPEQILDRMFALGEIDEQTYRARRSALAEMRRSS